MRRVDRNTSSPASTWARPTGSKADNPWERVRDLGGELPQSVDWRDGPVFPGDLIPVAQHLRQTGFDGYAATVADAVQYIIGLQGPD